MDLDLQRYYEQRQTMMASNGWNDLMEDVSSMIESIDHIDGIPDAKSLHFKQGELSILKWLKGLKQTSEDSYNQLKGE